MTIHAARTSSSRARRVVGLLSRRVAPHVLGSVCTGISGRLRLARCIPPPRTLHQVHKNSLSFDFENRCRLHCCSEKAKQGSTRQRHPQLHPRPSPTLAPRSPVATRRGVVTRGHPVRGTLTDTHTRLSLISRCHKKSTLSSPPTATPLRLGRTLCHFSPFRHSHILSKTPDLVQNAATKCSKDPAVPVEALFRDPPLSRVRVSNKCAFQITRKYFERRRTKRTSDQPPAPLYYFAGGRRPLARVSEARFTLLCTRDAPPSAGSAWPRARPLAAIGPSSRCAPPR